MLTIFLSMCPSALQVFRLQTFTKREKVENRKLGNGNDGQIKRIT